MTILKAPESGFKYAINQSVAILDCASCGITFGITTAFMERRREDHEGFYCPNGHSNAYSGENKEERLERSLRYERDHTARLSAQLEQEKAHSRAQKSRGTRYKNERDRIRARVAEGVCPCCNRQFKGLKSHMRIKHPEWVEEHGATAFAQEQTA